MYGYSSMISSLCISGIESLLMVVLYNRICSYLNYNNKVLCVADSFIDIFV